MRGETENRKPNVFEIGNLTPKENDKKEDIINRKHNVLIGFQPSNFFHTSFRCRERGA